MKLWMVGSDNSSETQGSSKVIVVGKMRSPTSQWACAVLLVRVNRKLAKEGQERLKAAKGKARETLGAYYVLDLRRNEVKATHVQLEPYARKLGVLEPYEALVCE
jgi:hypothetical protein